LQFNNNKIINIGDSKFLIIELTKTLKLDIEVFPGDPKPKRMLYSDIKKGWHHYIHCIGDHLFQPHADAPNHQNPELQNKGIECFDLDYSFNEACLLDVSKSKESKEFDGIQYTIEIKKEDLTPFSNLISKRNAVVFRTGYDLWLESNKPHKADKIPYLNKEAAEFIGLFDNIKVVGIDSLTVDPSQSHVAHQIFKDKLIVESMPFLHKIPKESQGSFLLQTSPVKIKGATGAPVIAYAFIKM
jgi:kynurenine formamidase